MNFLLKRINIFGCMWSLVDISRGFLHMVFDDCTHEILCTCPVIMNPFILNSSWNWIILKFKLLFFFNNRECQKHGRDSWCPATLANRSRRRIHRLSWMSWTGMTAAAKKQKDPSTWRQPKWLELLVRHHIICFIFLFVFDIHDKSLMVIVCWLNLFLSNHSAYRQSQ